MAELVDAQDSKSCDRKVMRVRFSLAAPKNTDSFRIFCYTSFTVSLFFEMASILAITTAVSLILHKLKQPLILAYLISGIIAGPQLLGLIHSEDTLTLLSKLGITSLLFIVGLSLSPKVMREVGPVSLAAGLGQVAITTVVGFLIAFAFGFATVPSLYIAICLTFSSTIIALKFLQDRRELGTVHGKISIGIMLVQDVAATLTLVFVSALNAGANSWQSFAIVFLKAALLGIAMTLVARVIFPALTKTFASSQEFLLLFSIAWGTGVAAVFQYAGFSIEIGALAAGVALASSPYHFEISSKMKILRDFFVAIFFILLGSQLLFSGAQNLILPVIVFSLYVLIGNPVILMSILGFMGYSRNVSFRTGLTMSQTSEFSLVLMAMALELGQVDRSVVALVTLVAMVTFSVSGYMINSADWLYERFEKQLKFFERKKTKREKTHHEEHEAILFGCHRLGRDFLPVLKELQLSYLVVDYDPMTVQGLKHEGVPAMYGDAEDNEFLEELDFSKTKLMISTLPDFDAALFLLTKLKREHPSAVAILMSHSSEEALLLYQRGADYVILPHYLGGNYASVLLSKFGSDSNRFSKERAQHIEHLKHRHLITSST